MSAANIPVFLELKKKVGGIVSKRRASLSWQEADRFMEAHKLPNTEQFLNRQVLEEISWIQTCQKLTPGGFHFLPEDGLVRERGPGLSDHL